MTGRPRRSPRPRGRGGPEGSTPDELPVVPRNRLPWYPRHVFHFVERAWDATDPARGVDGRGNEARDGSPPGMSAFDRLTANETRLVPHGVRQAHAGNDPVQASHRVPEGGLPAAAGGRGAFAT